MLKMEFGSNKNHEIFLSLKQTLHHFIKHLRLQVSCCVLCGNACQQHPLLCQYCQDDLPYFNHQIIGYDLLSWPAISKIIPTKKFDHLLSIAPYIWPFDIWISQLKYQHKTEVANLLSHLLVILWRQYLHVEQVNINKKNTLILAVPLHIKKWQERGFNQAHLIARQFARSFNYDYQTELIFRKKFTENQVGKSGIARRKNLKNAFAFNRDLNLSLPEHVILIDDVVTTGTTANEICQLLKKQGVQTITLLSICLALPN